MGCTVMITLLAVNALAGPVTFDRVDLLADDPGLWVNDDALRLQQTPRVGAMRFLGQVKVVVETPIEGVYVGASLSSQSFVVEQLIVSNAPIYGYAGLQTNWLLPRGVQSGLSYRAGAMRVSMGISGLSSATWSRPDWSVWTWLPTIGVGVGRVHPHHEEPVW